MSGVKRDDGLFIVRIPGIYLVCDTWYVLIRQGPIQQYATSVENLLNLARLELSCQARCVVHYFQYKRGHVLIFALISSLVFFNAKFFIKCCCILYLIISVQSRYGLVPISRTA